LKDSERNNEEAPAAILPADSWERLPGESPKTYAAFCHFMNHGWERNIRKAADTAGNGADGKGGRYGTWKHWSMKFQWMQRVGDYDEYMERLARLDMEKFIEERTKAYLKITGKMLKAASEKLDIMNPAVITPRRIPEWVETAIRLEREILGLTPAGGGKPEPVNYHIVFTQDFEGL
jgi:hypothetical protein